MITVWDMYFMTIVGWQLHPRNDVEVDLDAAADLANEMLRRRSEIWDGLPLEPLQ
jgi:hypothetical protein